jgi:hypothetical protein
MVLIWIEIKAIICEKKKKDSYNIQKNGFSIPKSLH